ncbi:MAG: ATP-dependent metallopeptidase FtsH/Yme1/Tma family protein, partial [Candidatus Omnitrophota bacterium]
MNNKDKNVQGPPRRGSNLMIWFLIALGVVTLLNPLVKGNEKPTQEITYARFFGILKDNPATNAIKSCYKTDSILRGELSTGDKFIVNIPENDQDLVRLLRENVKDFDIKPLRTFWSNIF